MLENPNKISEREIEAFRAVQRKIYQQNLDMGWHTNPREDGTMIALCISELSEALEGFRKDLMDDHLGHRKMAEVELADCVIRILDFAAKKGYSIGDALAEKHDYNFKRADHKLENRMKAGGKAF